MAIATVPSAPLAARDPRRSSPASAKRSRWTWPDRLHADPGECRRRSADRAAHLRARRIHGFPDDGRGGRARRVHARSPSMGRCLLIRAFFSLQSPWVPTTIALRTGVNAALADAAFLSLRHVGDPARDLVREHGRTFALIVVFRRRIGRMTAARSSGRNSSSSLPRRYAGVAAGVWYGLDHRSAAAFFAQILTVGSGLVAAVVYLLRETPAN